MNQKLAPRIRYSKRRIEIALKMQSHIDRSAVDATRHSAAYQCAP